MCILLLNNLDFQYKKNMEIIIPNKEKFEKIKVEMKEAGFDKLHVLADFDRTLTYGVIDGKKTPSIISLLRDGNHLTEGYAEKAHALFDKYSVMENDLALSLEERKAAMQEWWGSHNKLLTESGLEKSDLEDIVNNGHLKFREGVLAFLDFLHEKKIPLVILSASGCGDAIEMFLEKSGRNYSNVFYVTNQFNWDEEGKAVSIKGSIIHGLNKDETILQEIPEVYNEIKERKNVILLGDSLGDLGMVEGFSYENLLSIGLFNSGDEELEEKYLKIFDVVLAGDGDWSFVNELIENLEK